jgi:hypothetical protein
MDINFEKKYKKYKRKYMSIRQSNNMYGGKIDYEVACKELVVAKDGEMYGIVMDIVNKDNIKVLTTFGGKINASTNEHILSFPCNPLKVGDTVLVKNENNKYEIIHNYLGCQVELLKKNGHL